LESLNPSLESSRVDELKRELQEQTEARVNVCEELLEV
jgi:hypothetical protein